MDMGAAFPSRFLKPQDLEGDRKVQILDVMMEQVQTEFKPVIYFRGVEKGLVLNRTNNTVLISLFGKESNNWKGKSVTLYPSTVVMNNQVHPCIRIRNGGAAVPKREELNDDVPY